MNRFQHVYATDIDHAVSLLQTHGPSAALVAGGSDMLAMMKERLVVPKVLINLQRVPGIDSIDYSEGRPLRIGALAKLNSLETSAILEDRFTALWQAAGSVASPQIRNVATVGGNIAQRTRCWYYRGPFNCWLKGGTECPAVDGENKYHAVFGGGPCYMVQASDLATALIAMNGQVIVAGAQGQRAMPAEQFFVNPSPDWRRENMLGPGEVVTEIFVPPPIPGSRSGFVKAMERNAWDAAIVSIAYSIVEENGICREITIALGGVATTPIRATQAERMLSGRRMTPEAFELASEGLLSQARPMSGNAYKLPLLKGYFQSIFTA